MADLNQLQIIVISKELEKKGLREGILHAELLDHTCSSVEEKIDKGAPFPEALKKAIENFEENELNELEEKVTAIHDHKFNLMKKITWFGSSMAATAMLISVFTQAQDAPTISPLEGGIKVTSGFGMRVHPIHKEKIMHTGIDLRASTGTPVKATATGMVEKVIDQNEGYGKRIIIRHDAEYSTSYSQLSAFNVSEGDKVELGDVIGYVGSSGTSTAPHLHYEVIKNGEKVNPVAYMNPK